MEAMPLKKSIQTLVSTRLPTSFTVFHPFQFHLFHLLPVEIELHLPAEGKEFLFPPAADVVIESDTNRLGLFPLAGDPEEVLDQGVGDIQCGTHIYHLFCMI
jgi:hypothetical protein